jgi:hypothetical protein
VAADELERFTRFCERHLRLEDGAPLVVEGFQKTMLSDYFAGTTETIILCPKKAGKSTLVGALSLYHLATTPDAECVVVAASREQAGILFGQAAGFVRRSEWLRDRVKLTMRELRSRGDAGRIRVLAADADTADGTICTLAVVDEVARHRSAELYGTLRDGLGPRQGRLIGISTAGDDEDSPLGRMRRAAHGLPTVERHGAYRLGRGQRKPLTPGEDHELPLLVGLVLVLHRDAPPAVLLGERPARFELDELAGVHDLGPSTLELAGLRAKDVLVLAVHRVVGGLGPHREGGRRDRAGRPGYREPNDQHRDQRCEQRSRPHQSSLSRNTKAGPLCPLPARPKRHGAAMAVSTPARAGERHKHADRPPGVTGKLLERLRCELERRRREAPTAPPMDPATRRFLSA